MLMHAAGAMNPAIPRTQRRPTPTEYISTPVSSHLQVARQWRPSPTAWWRSRAASRSSRAWYSTGCWSTAPPRRPCRLSARTPAPSAWRPRMPCSTTARSRFANVSVALAGRSTASGSTGRWGSQVSWRRRCVSACVPACPPARLPVCPSVCPTQCSSITSGTTYLQICGASTVSQLLSLSRCIHIFGPLLTKEAHMTSYWDHVWNGLLFTM